MANKDTFSKVIGGGPPPRVTTVKPKPKPSAKPVVKAPSRKPVLDSSYKFVFDPSGWQSPEAQAVRDLYAAHTKKDLATEPDPQQALLKHGVIHTGASAKDVAGLHTGAMHLPGVFASATDAIDAISRGATAKADLGKVFAAGNFVAPEFVRKPLFEKLGQAASWSDKNLVVPAEKAVWNAPIPGARGETSTLGGGVRQAGENIVTGLSAAAKGIQAAHESTQAVPGAMSGGGARGGGAPVTAGLKKSDGIDISGALGSLPTFFQPLPTYGEIGGYAPAQKTRTLSDTKSAFMEATAKPNTIIDLSVLDKTIPASFKVSPVKKGLAEAAINGQVGATIDSIIEQNPGTLFSDSDMVELRARNKSSGWPVDNKTWDALSMGERISRAYTQHNEWKLALRNGLAAVAGQAATPAAAVAIGRATWAGLTDGQWAEAGAILNSALAPLKGFNDVLAKQGAGAATKWAFVNYPVDTAMLIKGGANVLGRGLGAGARLAGSEYAAAYRPVEVAAGGITKKVAYPIVEQPLRGPGDIRAGTPSLAEAAAAERAVAAKAEALRAQGSVTDAGTPLVKVEEPVTGNVQIGTTSPNLFKTVVLRSIKAKLADIKPPEERLASQGDSFSYDVHKWVADKSRRYRDSLAGKGSKRTTRLQLNVFQGVMVQMEEELTKALGRAPSALERERAAFELIFPKHELLGGRVTPQRIAEYFDGRIRDLDAGRVSKTIDGVRQIVTPDSVAGRQLRVRWDHSAENWRRIGDVVLEPDVVSRLRKVAKPIGKQNDVIVAAAVGVSVDEIKRGNYLRLLQIDPDFEMVSQLFKEASKTAAQDLVKLQKKIAKRAARLNEKVSEHGVGKAPSVAVREAKFVKRVSELVGLLDEAINHARHLGDDVLAAQYQAVREELARVAAAQADTSAADVANSVRLAEAAGLKTPARPASIAAAERRVAIAEDQLAKGDRFLISHPKHVEKLRKKVDAERARLDRLTASRAFEDQRTVLDRPNVQATIDATESVATVRIRKRKKDYAMNIERARGEVIDDFIARVEASDQQALLHLTQRQNRVFQAQRDYMSGESGFDLGDMGFTNKNRYKPSNGYLFAQGGEDVTRMWRNLMYDTTELTAAAGFRAKMNDLVQITSVPVEFNAESLASAAERARQIIVENPLLSLSEAAERALEETIKQTLGYEYSVADFKVLNPISPGAKRPSEVTNIASVDPTNVDVQTLLLRELTERSIDPSSPGTYYLMPRGVWNGINDALKQESYSFKAGTGFKGQFSRYNIDRFMRWWRNLTLNVMPKTAFNNFVGSAILAIQAGATPRHFYYAWKAMNGQPLRSGRKLSLPPELIQKYRQLETMPIGAGQRGVTSAGLLKTPSDVSVAFNWAGWWTHTMRHFNGMSEDFSRLAVYYSEAAPAAMRQLARDNNVNPIAAWFHGAKGLNDAGMDMIDLMVADDPAWHYRHQEFLQKSFDFLGDLHQGGALNAHIRLAIPFAQWYAHMLKLTFFTMPLKYPGRALMLQRLGEIGTDYQKTHGVIVPWGASLIPLFEMFVPIERMPQWVTQAIDSSTWYPQATSVSMFNLDGDINAVGYANGVFSPIVKNSYLLTASTAAMLSGGSALEYNDYKVLESAKDANGNAITGSIGSSDFARYFANRLFEMFPLSPMIMSSAARTVTSLPIPGLIQEKKRTKAGLEPTRVDLAGVFDDNWKFDIPLWVFRATVGTPVEYEGGRLNFARVPGAGFITNQKEWDEYQRLEREWEREQQLLAEKLYEAQNGF